MKDYTAIQKKKKIDTQSDRDETHRHYDEAKKPDTKD